MKIFITLLLIFSFNVHAKNSMKQYKIAKWNHIMKLLNQEIHSIQSLKKRSRSLEYRLLELYSEKIKLYKEKENAAFLKQTNHKNINREAYFKKTLKHYNKARNFAVKTLKKYKRHPYKAAIYYTLALNSRDFAYDNREYKYLKLSLKYAKRNSVLHYRATTALADYYYNIKKYHHAISQYNKVIHNTNDDWLTKYLYNLSWCLLKTHKFEEAIGTIENAYKLSKDQRYIDVREQALSSITTFYVYGKSINRGIDFLQQYSKNITMALTTLATKTSQKGYYNETITIFNLLENKYDIHKKPSEYADYNLLKFDVYNQYQKHQKLLKVANLLPTLKLDEYQRESAIDKITAVVGPRQLILKKDYDEYTKTYNKSILNEVKTYFNALIKLNPPKAAQYHYYIAESLFSIGEHKQALAQYKETLKENEKTYKEFDLRQKSIDAIFACIEEIKFDIKEKREELKFAYSKYLQYWPKTLIADQIYQRLYFLYLKTKKYASAQKVLIRYSKNYKKQRPKQRELFTAYMDKLIKEKDTTRLSISIKTMAKGFLNYKKDFIVKSEKILANILFSKYQKLIDSGNIADAREGYKRIFHNESYPKSIKANAAFNIGKSFSTEQEYAAAFKWYSRSFQYFTKVEKKQKRNELEVMANKAALSNDFLNSAKLEHYIVKQFCIDKKKNITNFKNSISYNLANDYVAKTFYILEKRKACIPKIETETLKQVMVHLWNNNHENDLLKFIDQYKLVKIFPNEISTYYERYFWKYQQNNATRFKLYTYRLKKLATPESKKLFYSYKQYLTLKKMVKNYRYDRIKISKNITPDDFINKLNLRIQNGLPIKNQSEVVFKEGHPELSLMTLKIMISLSQSMAIEFNSYQLPIKDKNFQKQFKAHMKGLTKNYEKLAQNQKEQRTNLVEKFEIFSNEYVNDSITVGNFNNLKRSPSSTSQITIELAKD